MKKIIFWLFVLIFLIYSGIQFGKPYYRYFVLKADANEIARVAIESDEKIRIKVFERAQELNIPLSERDIEVSKTDSVTRIRTSWFEVVDIFGVYKKTLKFTVDTAA